MKTILKIEELAQLGLGVFLFTQLSYSWWLFPVFLLAPDIGMVGYLVNPKVGAMAYNLFHHKAIGIAFIVLGMLFFGELYTFVGIIIFSHASLDRVFGYGLKYFDDFKHTHLGEI